MTPFDIIRETARKHGLLMSHIVGPSRYKSYVLARHEAMARCREELGLSYPAIAKWFDRNHDVVIRGIRRHHAGHPRVRYAEYLDLYHRAYHANQQAQAR